MNFGLRGPASSARAQDGGCRVGSPAGGPGRNDPRGDGNMSVMQRIEQDYPYLDFRTAGALDDGDVIMVAKDERFVEVINAQSPTNLTEEVDFGLATK